MEDKKRRKQGQCFVAAFDDEGLAAKMFCYCQAPFFNQTAMVAQ